MSGMSHFKQKNKMNNKTKENLREHVFATITILPTNVHVFLVGHNANYAQQKCGASRCFKAIVISHAEEKNVFCLGQTRVARFFLTQYTKTVENVPDYH
jgi:hypothetical protein